LLGPIAGVYGLFRLAIGGEQFNRAMRESLAIMGDVSEEMRTVMRKTAIDAAKETAFGAAEVAKSYYYLASAGLDAAQSVAALPQTARFARAGMFDIARAAELAAGSVAALGMKGNTTAEYLHSYNRVTDVLVKANTLANATVDQFATALGTNAANAARMAGQSIEDVVAVLAAFADKMVKGEEAGSAYARAINYLSIQATQNQEAFRKAGVRMFDAADNTRTLVDVIQDLENRFAGMTDKERTAELIMLGFTKKTIALMNTVIGTSEQIRHFTRELQRAGGTTREVAEKQLTPFQKGWTKLRATLTDVGGKVMDWLGPKLGTAAAGLAVVVEAVKVPLQALMETFSEFGGLVVDVFRLGWNYIGQFASGIQVQLSQAFGAIVDGLDVMLGSLQGWSAGAIYIGSQVASAFAAAWEVAFHSVKMGFASLLPEMLRLLERFYRAGSAALEGSTLQPVFEKYAKNMANSIKHLMAKMNLEAEPKRHEAAMARIGEASLKASEEYGKRIKNLPKLSDRLRMKLAEIDAAGKAPMMPGRGAGLGLGEEEEAKAPELQFAGALQRGTTEAYSAILRGMSAREGPEKRMADDMRKVERNTKGTVDNLADIKLGVQDLVEGQTEGMEIPGG
jgi:TP901 family phage tail tape measure protein